jgi:hypothetical protein
MFKIRRGRCCCAADCGESRFEGCACRLAWISAAISRTLTSAEALPLWGARRCSVRVLVFVGIAGSGIPASRLFLQAREDRIFSISQQLSALTC